MMKENEENFSSNKKVHREQHSGRKAEKKKNKKKEEVCQDLTDKQRNPKAFAFNSAIGAERRFRRKQDIQTKKQHIPLVDRTPVEPPPILIAVVGPPRVGKTTLINNLVKLFSKSPLMNINGPVTIVIGKKRRITLVECKNNINSMIDLAKAADLALLLCDASFGFEMEVFEFVNICQVHGMPRIMGILTHLDMIKNSKTLKNTKKSLKHRFWTEVYPGAKLFYLSGISYGEYLRNEIKNLGRFISIMKFRPLTWRLNHSYLLVDRFEDLTSLELIRQNSNCDRNISLYGYIRGIPLNNDASIHIAGFGDTKVHYISHLPDPCPLPDSIKKRALVEREKLIYAPFSGVGGIIYDKDAVYVELGGSHSYTERNNEANNILMNLIETKETLDIKMQHSQLKLFTKGEKMIPDDLYEDSDDNDLENIVKKLDKPRQASDDVGLNKELRKLRETVHNETIECDGLIQRKLYFEDIADYHSIENVNKVGQQFANCTVRGNNDEIHLKVSNILKSLERPNKRSYADSDIGNTSFEYTDSSEGSEDKVSTGQNYSADSDNDFSSETYKNKKSNFRNKYNNSIDYYEDMAVKWKQNLTRKAKETYLAQLQTTKNVMKLVYGAFDKNIEHVDEGDEIGGLFRVVSSEQKKVMVAKDNMEVEESSLSIAWSAQVEDFTHIENKWKIEDCFITGKWNESEDARKLLEIDATEVLNDSDESGDFEDLETGQKIEKNEYSAQKDNRNNRETVEINKEVLIEKKLKSKQKFDAEYDAASSYYNDLKLSAEKQTQFNKSVFENMTEDLRIQFEGYRPGMYVRLEIRNVASEFVTNFDPTCPILIGAVNVGEENIGYVNVKIKKHRWYKRILKSNDPLIVSLGWRRFQILPLYSKLEDDLKYRYLKFAPEHLSCNAHFWGPITPQGTGFLALQACEGDSEIVKRQGFRIAATGTVQELDKSTRIMKKLKLVGYPTKIYRKTAFIKGMFNSSLEVAKFEGSRIKTVSGIRGQIKKAVNKPEGCFRATFEDKIQLSDIVFCRTWYKVDVQQFYMPFTPLLLPVDKRNSWTGVRTKGVLKRQLDIKTLANSDSLYTEVVREQKVFKPLIIPKKLQHALPYKDKSDSGLKSTGRIKNIERIAIVKEPYEQKISKVMKMIKTTYNHKQLQLKEQTNKRLLKHREIIKAIEANKASKLRKQKKERLRTKSKTQIREETKRTEYSVT